MVDLSVTKMNDLINAKDYSETHTPYTLQYFLDLSAEAGLDLSNCKRILDVGVGSGEITCEIAKLATNAEYILGFDLAPEFIKYADEVKTDKRIEYFAQDATKPYPEEWGKFDMIISNLTLVRIADQAAVINNMKNCLAPGGKVFITHFNIVSGPHADAYRKVCGYAKWQEYIPGDHRQSLDGPKPIWDDIYKYSDFVKSFGFKILSNDQRKHVRKIGDKANVARLFFNNQSQYFIPEALRSDYWDDILNCYPENIGKTDDLIIRDFVSYVYFELE